VRIFYENVLAGDKTYKEDTIIADQLKRKYAADPAGKYTNIAELPSIRRLIDGRVRLLYRVPTYVFSGKKAWSRTYVKLLDDYYITVDGDYAINLTKDSHM
jgi:hypothetical protein